MARVPLADAQDRLREALEAKWDAGIRVRRVALTAAADRRRDAGRTGRLARRGPPGTTP